MLNRREVVRALLQDRRDFLVVSGLGAPTYDVAAVGDDDRNFYLWGAMGGACMVGLGLALARPEQRVLVITGDGEMLMGIGSLATIAQQSPANLAIVVLDNGQYGETGMQASHTSGPTDLAGVALGCGISKTMTARESVDLDQLVHAIHTEAGLLFACVRIGQREEPRVLPTRDGVAVKVRFRRALGVTD